ncbi:hypothetical protein EB796_007203 [Bugula neritina]|uniref:Uncharacterized protein n=1 Tax=Bugula neritina TaxID=10212 RepID=A0A7J7K768_BUGNE|nr:hypothetical protein EB796_007203 [Bugula neritina]
MTSQHTLMTSQHTLMTSQHTLMTSRVLQAAESTVSRVTQQRAPGWSEPWPVTTSSPSGIWRQSRDRRCCGRAALPCLPERVTGCGSTGSTSTRAALSPSSSPPALIGTFASGT